MEVIWILGIIAFTSIGAVLIFKAYLPIIKHGKTEGLYRKYDREALIEHELDILRSSNSTDSKASAFIELMHLAYISVHTLVNKGNNYSDKVQSERFKKSLTPESLMRLNSLEGRYE